MTDVDLAARVREARLDPDEFDARVEEEAAALERELEAGTFDNPQAIVGLEYEFYGVDRETAALSRIPRPLLEYIGFEKELGLHNAEMNTSPQPFNRYGLASQEAEVSARLLAAQRRCAADGIRLVSDGLWTLPPTGEDALEYLRGHVVEDGIRLATNMSASARYHALSNVPEAVGYEPGTRFDAPGISLEAETVLLQSLATSIQPHYQVPHALDLPAYFRYALRIAGPLLAVGVNSPFVPPACYEFDATDPDAPAATTVLEEGWAEHRIPAFEGVFNPADDQSRTVPTDDRPGKASADDRPGKASVDGQPGKASAGGQSGKVCFPQDFETVGEAVERLADDPAVVPTAAAEAGRFDDRFAHLRHKHGSYWRWVRPVFEGATRSAANARIEFRPLPAQPTVADSVAFLATFAGVLESLFHREHPVETLPWEVARENFDAAVRDGLGADLVWITADGEETTDRERVYAELFEAARDGLELRDVPGPAADAYLRPLRGRVRRGVTLASWKRERVAERLDAGQSLAAAIDGMQREYVTRQSETLLEGSFLDWLPDG